MKRAGFSTVAFLTMILASAVVVNVNAAPASLREGVYTAEQAESGKSYFDQSCSLCHNVDYYKTVLQTWRGQPLLYLFEQMMSAMPADNPGAFLDSEYEDVMAYILSITGFPAGDTRLEYANGMMRDIPLEPAAN
jgi:mono/diheme cytochrome c family protein